MPKKNEDVRKTQFFSHPKHPKKFDSFVTFVILSSKQNTMDLSGKIINQLPEVGGNSKSGNAWRKREYIIETGGQYPKKVCVSIWGDKIDQFGLKVGEQVTLGIDVESREYNGRWYTEVKAFKVDRANSGGGAPSMPEVDTFYSESDEDKLPF